MERILQTALRDKFCNFPAATLGLDQQCIGKAYDEAEALLRKYLAAAAPNEDAAWPRKWFRQVAEAGNKAQLQIPLANLLPPPNAATTTTDDDARCAELPENLQRVAWQLESVLTQHLHFVADLVPSSSRNSVFPASSSAQGKNSRSPLLSGMLNKSVLRLWIYESDEVSSSAAPELVRAHFDPGFATCLLAGSRPGLQVHRSFTGASAAADTAVDTGVYEHATHDVGGEATDPKDWVSVTDPLSVTLMNGTMCRLLSGGRGDHCFHRVVPVSDDEGAKSAAEVRIQIVVELRPDKPMAWYALRKNATTTTTTE